MKTKVNVRELAIAAACLALCLLLPFLTGQIPSIGSMLAPMHIPVLVCGFLCGWPYALLVGLIAPPLRFALFGMPPLMPTGVAMMAELAVYGLAASLLCRALPKKPAYVYVTLVLAMLLGRLVWGAARLALAGLSNGAFTFQQFLAGAFTTALPGIICHIVIIPPIVLAVERAGIVRR